MPNPFTGRRSAIQRPALLILGSALALACILAAPPARSETPADAPPPDELKLADAVICEQVEGFAPKNPAVVFPLDIGEVACFTSFDPVPEATVIYHQWYYRDKPSSRIRLRLKTPRWSSFSRIQLRPGDAGPWRVEVLDADERRLAVLRFSVVE